MASRKVRLLGGNYDYQLPPEPSNEKDILFIDKKKKDQKWEIPDDIKRFREMSVSEKKQFVERERDRWENGVHFMNNGELTYITGMHYDHLVYQTFEFGKPKYLDSQRHDFYFRDYVRKDDRSFGMLWLKPRRYGMTAEEITNQQYVAMSDYGQQCGLVSNENKKTIDSIFRPIVDSYIKRPKFLRPKIYMPNGKKPKKEMLFQSAVVKDSDDELFFDTNGELNGWIIPKPTTVTAYDALKLHYLTADEVWKWIICNPSEFWGSHKKCLEDGGDIVGKASLLSTMGDSDDYKEAILCGVNMWHSSDPDVKDENGRTVSGLYRYFIDAIYAMRKYADEWGFINKDQAEAHLSNDLALHPVGSKEYIYEKRRMPRTPEDALLSADGSTVFDNIRLGKRLQIINKTPDKEKPYVRGVFNDLPDGSVEFEPDRYGIWKMAQLPFRDAIAGINNANRFKKVNGKYYKPFNPEYGAGYDGVNFADVDTVSGNKSRAACIIKQKFDYYGNGGQNRYAALCVYRPEDPEDADLEMIKGCKFFAAPFMIDRSSLTRIKKVVEEQGMLDFMLRNPKDKIYGIWSDNQRRFTKDGINLIQAYNRKPENEEDTDWVNEYPFEEQIEDQMLCNPLKMTKSDVLIASMLAENALMQIKETSLVDMGSSGLIKNNPLWPTRS